MSTDSNGAWKQAKTATWFPVPHLAEHSDLIHPRKRDFRGTTAVAVSIISSEAQNSESPCFCSRSQVSASRLEATGRSPLEPVHAMGALSRHTSRSMTRPRPRSHIRRVESAPTGSGCTCQTCISRPQAAFRDVRRRIGFCARAGNLLITFGTIGMLAMLNWKYSA